MTIAHLFFSFSFPLFLVLSFFQRPSAKTPNFDQQQNIIWFWKHSIYTYFHIYIIYNQFNKSERRTHFLLFQSFWMKNDKRRSILSSLILRIFSQTPSIIPTHYTYDIVYIVYVLMLGCANCGYLTPYFCMKMYICCRP